MKLIHQKRFDDQMKSNGRAEAYYLIFNLNDYIRKLFIKTI